VVAAAKKGAMLPALAGGGKRYPAKRTTSALLLGAEVFFRAFPVRGPVTKCESHGNELAKCQHFQWVAMTVWSG
jgi:hypothetical protein